MGKVDRVSDGSRASASKVVAGTGTSGDVEYHFADMLSRDYAYLFQQGADQGAYGSKAYDFVFISLDADKNIYRYFEKLIEKLNLNELKIRVESHPLPNMRIYYENNLHFENMSRSILWELKHFRFELAYIDNLKDKKDFIGLINHLSRDFNTTEWGFSYFVLWDTAKLIIENSEKITIDEFRDDETVEYGLDIDDSINVSGEEIKVFSFLIDNQDNYIDLLKQYLKIS